MCNVCSKNWNALGHFFFFINKSFFFTTLDPSPTNDAKNEALNFANIFDLSALTSFGQWRADTLYDVRKRSRYQMREFFFRCPNSKSSAREKQQSFFEFTEVGDKTDGVFLGRREGRERGR